MKRENIVLASLRSLPARSRNNAGSRPVGRLITGRKHDIELLLHRSPLHPALYLIGENPTCSAGSNFCDVTSPFRDMLTPPRTPPPRHLRRVGLALMLHKNNQLRDDDDEVPTVLLGVVIVPAVLGAASFAFGCVSAFNDAFSGRPRHERDNGSRDALPTYVDGL